ncbi:hypothetical protein Goarm_020764, partial [Gossypium armourianum]|nr:hypothetical protein [Gossypium armourianum]
MLGYEIFVPKERSSIANIHFLKKVSEPFELRTIFVKLQFANMVTVT